jgi:hypothetical protein
VTETLGPRVRVIACGAIARELVEVIQLNELANVSIECLPPELHNRPERIPDALRGRIRAAKLDHDRVLVGYADCGTGGRLDALCAEEGVDRLPGAHCYELFAGSEVFASLHDREPGTFYLTDYLTRNFQRLVIEGLGIADHPELEAMYFGNYRRLVHLAQSDDADLAEQGRRAAARLGLAHERIFTGTGALDAALIGVAMDGKSEPSGALP